MNYGMYYQYAIAALSVVIGFVIICNIKLTMRYNEVNTAIESLLDLTSRMSKVLADHNEQIELLGMNTEPEEAEIENERNEEQKNLDDRYNEGMDNIFGYSVNTGIRMGNR